MDLPREFRFVRENENEENNALWKINSNMNYTAWLSFYNYVFDWLFGLSFHKCREWMWYNMDVYIRSVSSFVLSFLFWTLYSLPWWKLFFHSKSSEYLKLEFSSSYQEFLRLCSDFWRQSSFFFHVHNNILKSFLQLVAP